MQRAVETVPDIIISDVLMPRMDGYELCSEVKKNKDICHIPVILLTAKVMDEEQIRGYDQGADMYLSKPFNPSVLISIVNRMMAKQDKLKALLISACGAQDSVPAEKDVRLELSPLDRKFLDKLYKYIEDNISNGDSWVIPVPISTGKSKHLQEPLRMICLRHTVSTARPSLY